jgi:glutamate-1-semialdehyde aminotransferase
MATNLKEKYLAYLIEIIDARCNISKDHIEAYRPYLSNNRNLANFSLLLKEMIFTLGIENAEGAYFTDLNGNRYLDMTMGFGVHLFGHKAAFLEKAIEDQLKKGIALGPLYREAAEVATLIHELTGVERCAFYNTGTEAVMVAMRIARAVTRKNKVVIFEGSYHGTHDSLLAVKSDPLTHIAITSVPGVSQNALDSTIILKYGDPASLSFIAAYADDIAAVLTEPVMSRHPEIASREFLHQLRTACTDGQVALIFDEVITGFRVHNGGAANFFGIVPDIVTYGKIAGGGIPIGVVAGKSLFLDAIDGGQWKFGDDSGPLKKTTFTAGTFNHHPLAMATARATLLFLKEDGGRLQQRLNTKTANLCNELNAFFDGEGFPVSMVHFSSLFRFKLTGMHKLIYYSLLKEGIYIWEGRNCFLSTAHTGQDITFFIDKVKKCCFELAAAGILNRQKKHQTKECRHVMQSAIGVQAVLDKSSLDFACRYLFNSILKLRPVSCSVRFKALNDDKDPVLTGTLQEDGLAISVLQNQEETVIHFSADRDICDGWSVILFFKALAACYKSLQNRQPLPDINYPAGESISKIVHYSQQQSGGKSLQAKTIHASIPADTIPPQMMPRLFAYMLYSFYRALPETPLLERTVISIPMAGQLLSRNLKVFDNCTFHFPCEFRHMDADADEEMIGLLVDKIELQLKKGKQAFNDLRLPENHPDIVFNMDNLGFELSFDNEKSRLVVVEEKSTEYKLVCNVSKLKESLLITLKYATGSVTDCIANDVLYRFLKNMQKTSNYEHR